MPATEEELKLARGRAMINKLEADAEKARAEASTARAQTRCAEAAADLGAISLERERRKELEELASNKYHRVYHFTSSVDGRSVEVCMDRLAFWSRTEPGCDITVVFTSPGGSVIDGLALFDFIQELRRKGHCVTTKALGMAASMAGILLQAGTRRVMARESYVLIHEISAGAVGKIGEIEDEVKFIKKIQGRILDIFAARSKVPRTYYAKRWNRTDWWLDSSECLKIGFVDEVE